MDAAAYSAFTDALSRRLAGDPRVVGLVALGSMSGDGPAPDDFSDHDFFVLTRSGAQEAFRTDLGWLPGAERAVLVHRETEHGLKVVLDDGQLVAWLKSEYGLSHGNANTLVHTAAERARPDVDPVAEQYAGGKVGLRPIYEALVAAATFLGDDVEVAPRKTCVSLRRGKQFAMLTPATRTRLDLGLNLKGIDPGGRLRAASGMCTHTIALTSIEDVDDEVRGWLWEAYERA